MSDINDFVIHDGVLTQYHGPGGYVVIPEGVTCIGISAFSMNKALKSVSIPAGVTEIGSWAFFGCEKLTTVIIPDSIASIGEKAFKYCSSLISFAIPKGVTSIENEVFAECNNLTSITIPDGVISIGSFAFKGCKHLSPVSIPESVAEIGECAFLSCPGMADADGFVIIRNVLYDYCGGPDSHVVIPDSIVEIAPHAFEGSSVVSVTIPDSVTKIGTYAFYDCTKLTAINYNGSGVKVAEEPFGYNDAVQKITSFGRLPIYLPVNDLVSILSPGTSWRSNHSWDCIDTEVQLETILAKQSKKLNALYPTHKIDGAKATDYILSSIHPKMNSKACVALANLLTMMYDSFSSAELQRIYAALKPLKNAAKALQVISDCTGLMQKMGSKQEVDASLTGLARKVAENMLSKGISRKEAETFLGDCYGIGTSLPVLKDTSGAPVDALVLIRLLTVHEKLLKSPWRNQSDVDAAWGEPGLCPEAAEIVAELDHDTFMDALRSLARSHLGATGRSKGMFLAYPICRYADEKLMAELTKIAPSWRSSVSGNDAPPLLNFRKANLYSNTRAAMMFADKYKELDRYAKIRGTDADTLRDQNLSDVGIDANGCKTYDLGNQTVTARLQDDLSFLIELPTGTTAKSLPKKGADEKLYAKHNADFSEMKKAVKKILKNRFTILFQEFLSGKERDAAGWKAAYLENVLLRRAAKLLVWVQGKETFIVTDTGVVHADGTPYVIGDQKIALAHPMDMKADERTAWQRYFTTRGMKQPFEQVWEPVVDPATISKDRYKGCMIPYYRFTGQSKHGIHVEDVNFHNDITIFFDDCDAFVERIDWTRHEINMDDRFEVQQFSCRRYTRQVNHIVAYLDKITVFGRIAKDDITIADRIGSFTLAQITECLRIAQENNATGVTALLLEHKNTHFADFDPMDEFTLDL